MPTTEAQQQKHTPTPWVLAGPGQVFDCYGNEIAHCKSYGAGIMPIGYTAPWHLSEANAAHILHCVNTRDQVVNALDFAETALHTANAVMGVHELQDSKYDNARKLVSEAYDYARAALSFAKQS